MKIVLSGGGTLGSVSPLIAIWQELKSRRSDVQSLFIGTKNGPEKGFLAQYGDLSFKSIPAGKLRRYFSLLNITDPFLILAGFLKSFFILLKFRPDVIISAGSFVAVPEIFAGKLLGAKVLIHQLDLKPTLSNKLVSGLADKITVTFKKSLADFKGSKTLLVGSLLRQEIKDLKPKTEDRRPIVLILGGGTGALSINKLIADVVPLLSSDIQINHVTGKGKQTKIDHQHYHQYELLTDNYYQKINEAGLVISRAGLSSLMELSYLAKPTIIIPLPDSHQEANARYFAEHQAAVYFKQNELTPKALADNIYDLLDDKEKLANLGDSINQAMQHNGQKKVADIITNLV